MAFARVFGAALAAADIEAGIEIVEDATRGLTARVTPKNGAGETEIGAVLGRFARPWEVAA